MATIGGGAKRRPHILIVDNDRGARDTLKRTLQRHDLRVSEADNATEARNQIACRAIDLAIVDAALPDHGSLDLCRRIAATSAVPVILLGSGVSEDHRIAGLEAGADDYVLKPFSPGELVARINTILRRVKATRQRVALTDGASYVFGDLMLKTGERALVNAEGIALPLSAAEYELMLAFVACPYRVLSRDRLLEIVKRGRGKIFYRAIDNQISVLRKKVEPDPRAPTLIKTVWGQGYTLSAGVQELSPAG